MPEKSVRSNWWDEPAARQVLELQNWDSRWPFRPRRSNPRRLPRFLFLPVLSPHTAQYRCCSHVQKQRIQKSATQHRLCLDRQKTNSVSCKPPRVCYIHLTKCQIINVTEPR